MRLSTTTSGRFDVRAESPDGPDWIASFGPDAIIDNAELVDGGRGR